MLRSFLIALCLLISSAPVFADAASTPALLPELSIELSETNRGDGLIVPSGGDGANAPVSVGGRAARRMTGEGAQYLYAAVNHAEYRGPLDLYVTIEAFGDTYSRVSIEYDKAMPRTNIATQHMVGEGSLWLMDGGGWRHGVFFLPQARLGGGQNFNADFRLAAKDVAVHKITVSPRPPAGYDFTRPVDLPSLEKIRVIRPSGIDWTLGNDASAEDAAVYKALSATHIESYVDWAGVEPERDKWDWSRWDRQAAILKTADLKWTPFLIAGPAYATPLWFQRGDDAHVFRCLEHGQDSAVQSIFNPALRPAVKRFLSAFATRYREQNVLGSVLLGVTGIYGESLYPAGPEGGWTTRLTGDYHNHAGWWAGDTHAVRAFWEAMQRKYSSLVALNAAWSTRHPNWDAVKPLLPEQAPSKRARADTVEWYQDAMTEWSQFWAQSAREVLPRTPIYLVTGGSGTPQLGADFTAQAKAVAPFNVGIRITNEGNDYATNFMLTREVITATRHYKTYAGTEPAGNISPPGLVSRVYNVTSSGAREMHDYAANFTTDKTALEFLRSALPQLVPAAPRVSAALYVSRESWALQGGAAQRLFDLARPLRDLTDWDFVTRDTVKDGVLDDITVLLLCQSPVLEPAAAQAIESWVRKGGVLIASSPPGETLGMHLYDNTAWRGRLFSDISVTPQDIGTDEKRWRWRHHVRRIGRGYTIYLPAVDAPTLVSLMQPILRNTPKYLPDIAPLAGTDGVLDGRYKTQTFMGITRFEQDSAIISSP